MEETPIPITPEVQPAEKKKPKRSAKPKREQPENQLDATIQSHPAPEAPETSPGHASEPPNPAPTVNGAPVKQVYDWDRTQAEAADRAEQSRIANTPFPLPKENNLAFSEFCGYYNALIESPVGRYVRLYVARWWPVLLPVETVDDFGNPKDSFPNDLDKPLQAKDGPISQQSMLQMAGVGEYKFRLNDSRRPWKNQTIVSSELDIIDQSLWTMYPPVIDPKRLDMDAKRNQAYIKFARAHGYLPRDGAEEQNMSTVTAITDRALDEASKERARADQIQQEQLTRARQETEAAKLETARVTAEAEQAKRQAEELKTKIQPGTPAAELLSVVSSVATLANNLKPAPDTSFKDFLALEAERERTRREREKEERDAARESAKIERERADKLQAEVITIRTTPAPAAVATTPPTLVQQFQELEALMGAAKRISKGGSNTEESEEKKPSKVDKWLEAAPIIAPIFGSIVNGVFQTILTGLQVWERNHYNDALARKGDRDLKTPPNAEKVEPGKPIPPQAPTQTAEQIAQQQQWGQIMAGVQMLAPHLIRFLDKGKSGAELAEFVIENADEQRTSYERIRHLADSLLLIGVQIPGGTDLEKFTGACRFVFEKIPALWAKVGTLPTMPQFLSDFYNYDQIREEEENRLQEEQR